MQMLTIGLHAQSELSVYEFIKAHYYSHKADSVANIQAQDLIAEGVQGDSLYYGQILIARANQKIGDQKEALNRLGLIPVDKIKHRDLFFDVVFLEALIYYETRQLLKADSIYSESLSQVPEEYPLLLTINYNNFANVKLFFLEIDSALAYYKKAIFYNTKTTDTRKAWRENLHLANLSNLYLNLGDIKQAKKYHDQIIPSAMDIERRLSWELNAGKIDMAEENYENAILRFTNVKSIAHSYDKIGLQRYIDTAVMLTVKASTMHQREKNEFRFKIIGFIAIFVFLRVFRRIKKYLIPKKLKERLSKANLFRKPEQII
jgi:tetratricopeptide (TPR) repeat protein